MNPDKAAEAMEKGIDLDMNTDADADADADSLSEDGFNDETPTIEDTNTGFLDNITGRLMATEPNPDLETVENPWNPEAGGTTRIYRGIQKMGDIEGLPAIADIIIGILELTQDDSFELGHENTNTENNSQSEVEQI